MFLVFGAPCQLRSLAGQEHGRPAAVEVGLNARGRGKIRMAGWHHRSFVSSRSGGRQLPDPEITSPNSCQVVPSNFSNCICLIGAKSSALVETVMPGSSIGSFSS